MKFPKKVRLGYTDFEIILHKGRIPARGCPLLDFTVGVFNPTTFQIQISDILSQWEQYKVLMHEIAHYFYREFKGHYPSVPKTAHEEGSYTESWCDWFAIAILEFIQENPELIVNIRRQKGK